MAKKEIHSIHIEPAANGHMVTTRYKRDMKTSKYPYDMDCDEEKTVHESPDGVIDHLHNILGAFGKNIKGNSGQSRESGKLKKSDKDSKTSNHSASKLAAGMLARKK